jgi:hypothetical protein
MFKNTSHSRELGAFGRISGGFRDKAGTNLGVKPRMGRNIIAMGIAHRLKTTRTKSPERATDEYFGR